VPREKGEKKKLRVSRDPSESKERGKNAHPEKEKNPAPPVNFIRVATLKRRGVGGQTPTLLKKDLM